MTVTDPTNVFSPGGQKYQFSDKYSDLQRLVIGAHTAEIKNKTVQAEIKVTDPQKFKNKLDDIEFFFENITDKKIKFSFLSKNKTGIQQRFENTHFDYVSLFSGGLDSSSYPLLPENKQKYGLLSHTVTSPRMQGMSKQVYTKHMRQNHFLVNTKLNLENTENIPTVHVRGIVFLTNVLCMAAEYDIEKVIVPENGPFMINYPVSTLVTPTRTTNLEMISGWKKIVEDITGKKFVIETPFYGLTKSEVILKNNTPELIKTTWSCSTSQGNAKMCGLCMACFVRMLSLFAIDHGESINSIYEFNIFESSEIGLGSQNLKSFRILINCLEFWKYLIHPDLAPSDIERDRHRVLVRRHNVLVNHALDMYLGLKKYLVTLNRSSAFSIIAKKYLKEIDQSVIETRSNTLERKIRSYGD